jgi:hypothetical protein
MLALGYGRKRRLREKRKNANCVEDIVSKREENTKRSKRKKVVGLGY